MQCTKQLRAFLKGGYRLQVATAGTHTVEDNVFHRRFPAEGMKGLLVACKEEVENGWIHDQGDFRHLVIDAPTLKRVQSILLSCFVAGAVQGRIKGMLIC